MFQNVQSSGCSFIPDNQKCCCRNIISHSLYYIIIFNQHSLLVSLNNKKKTLLIEKVETFVKFIHVRIFPTSRQLHVNNICVLDSLVAFLSRFSPFRPLLKFYLFCFYFKFLQSILSRFGLESCIGSSYLFYLHSTRI